MNIHDLREAQASYENRIEEILKARKKLYQLRSSFVRYFTPARIRNMGINDYVLGVNLPQHGFNFCYTLERKLDDLGRIIGSTSFKFGVYYGKTRSDPNYKFRFTKKFGNTYQKAFEKVREAILQLLEAGRNEDIDAIIENYISPMFKGKILSTYFPERYLNVFSWEHLNYFLKQLDLDTKELMESDWVYKREALLDFKNQDPIMQNWSVDLFAHFLYNEYPERPPKEGAEKKTGNGPLTDYQAPDFPPNPQAEFISLDILPPLPPVQTSSGNHSGKGQGNPDYDKEAKKLRKLGDRGEKIVLDMERKRLKDAGKDDLAKKVKRISLKSDSYGYDILSFNEDGTKRLIEVKATRSKVGAANFFLTANELKIALSEKNYFIYMVYDIMSYYPKIWIISNPFNPKNKNVVRTPINYRITINASKA